MNLSITNFITSFSRERISVYQNYIHSSEPNLLPADISLKSLKLYLWNIQISSALFEVINLYEVTLRNKIFAVVNTEFSDSINDYFFKKRLSFFFKKKLNELGASTIRAPMIVSRLNFSFWTEVLNKHFYYSGSVDKSGHPLYPRLYNFNRSLFSINRKLTREDYNKLTKKLIKINDEVNELRNRICHHEPIFKSKLRAIYIKMLFVLRYLDTNVYQLAKEIERVNKLLKKFEDEINP